MMNKSYIPQKQKVKVKIKNNSAEVRTIINSAPIVKSHSKGFSLNTQSGEIIEHKQSELRGETKSSQYTLRKSHKAIIDIIDMNYESAHKVLLLTLSYAEKQSDREKILNDFKNFKKKLIKYSEDEFGKMEYLNKLELYDDEKNYHLHCVLFFNESKARVYIPKEILDKI